MTVTRDKVEKQTLPRVAAIRFFYTTPLAGYNPLANATDWSDPNPITDYESFAVDIITDVLVWSLLADGNTRAGLGDLLRRAHNAALAELEDM